MARKELILADAAKIARTTPDALRGAINRQRLSARKIGPIWVVSEDDLYEYLESKRTWQWTGTRIEHEHDPYSGRDLASH